jgi:uncharacterized protein
VIFVDTGAWAAYVSPDDQHHWEAIRWMAQNREPLITTDYVVDELLTFLQARGEPRRARRTGSLFFDKNTARLAEIYYLTTEDILAAWEVFRSYEDKEWSFTDCTSKVIIEKLGLAEAFAFDRHFRQFGAVTVVP